MSRPPRRPSSALRPNTPCSGPPSDSSPGLRPDAQSATAPTSAASRRSSTVASAASSPGSPTRRSSCRRSGRCVPASASPPEGPAMAVDSGKIRDFVQTTWDATIIPTLTDYIKIPAKSPMFDAQWPEHGPIDRAVELLRGWAGTRPIEGLRIEVVRLENRTPLLLMEAPGTGAGPVVLDGEPGR